MRNGALYIGETLIGNQVREGRGMLIKYDGSVYEGHWKDDKYANTGRLILSNSEVYQG